MLFTLLIGFAATVVFYLAIAMPLGDAYFGQLFTGHHHLVRGCGWCMSAVRRDAAFHRMVGHGARGGAVKPLAAL